MNIYQKLHKIQTQVMGLGKDSKSFGYQYVSGSKVLDAIKPLMNELQLILKQEVLSIENVRQDYNTKNGAKTEILSKVMMRFTWVDCETGEKDENLFGANGQNDFEKGLGSALTYAERYFLLKFFHINTDEDDIDNPNRKPQQQAQPQQQALTISQDWIVSIGDIKDLKDCNDFLIKNREALNNEKNVKAYFTRSMQAKGFTFNAEKKVFE
jgi:hypothetical protein